MSNTCIRPIHRFLPWYQMFERVTTSEQQLKFLYSLQTATELALTDKVRAANAIALYQLSGLLKAVEGEIKVVSELPF